MKSRNEDISRLWKVTVIGTTKEGVRDTQVYQVYAVSRSEAKEKAQEITPLEVEEIFASSVRQFDAIGGKMLPEGDAVIMMSDGSNAQAHDNGPVEEVQASEEQGEEVQASEEQGEEVQASEEQGETPTEEEGDLIFKVTEDEMIQMMEKESVETVTELKSVENLLMVLEFNLKLATKSYIRWDIIGSSQEKEKVIKALRAIQDSLEEFFEDKRYTREQLQEVLIAMFDKVMEE